MSHGPPIRRKNCPNGGAETCDNSINEIPPPDGGWGWMVVWASFMIHIITDGMTYSFGIFYVEFLEYFKEGKGYTAWIASILVGVTLCSGPITSSFVNRYGCRPVTIAGALLASVSIFVSMFANNILTLILTIGVGAGFGFGLIYLPAIVSVTMYFEKYRSLATGIAVCGSGFGTFVFAPLTEILIKSFGWRGAMLIISGIVLNCIIFGAMFRPLVAPKKNEEEAITVTELAPLKPKHLENLLLVQSDTPLSRSHSMGHEWWTHNNNQNETNLKMEQAVATITNGNGTIRSAVSQPLINIDRPRNDAREKATSGTMYRPDILYQGSLLNISEYKNRTDNAGTNNHYGTLRRNTIETQSQEIEKLCGCVTCSKETSDTFSEMMNFSLFKDVIFIIFTFSNFCTSIGFNIPYVYLAAQAESQGLSKRDASYLLASIGIANTVGRIILGYLSDKPWVNRLHVYNLCLTLCGIATAMSIFCHDFTSLVLYSCVYGFTIGAYVGLTSVILVDLLGLEKLTNAFGLLLLFQGIASLIGPPFAGWLFDITNSYNPGFLVSGTTIALSGLVLFAIPPLQRHNAKKLAQSKANGVTSS